jgi:hypothetical protein
MDVVHARERENVGSFEKLLLLSPCKVDIMSMHIPVHSRIAYLNVVAR